MGILGELCPICLRHWSNTVRPAVDHDHKTGEIRGIVCMWCNRYVIGRHRDYEAIKRASEYLTPPFTNWFVPKKKIKKRKRKSKQ